MARVFFSCLARLLDLIDKITAGLRSQLFGVYIRSAFKRPLAWRPFRLSPLKNKGMSPFFAHTLLISLPEHRSNALEKLYALLPGTKRESLSRHRCRTLARSSSAESPTLHDRPSDSRSRGNRARERDGDSEFAFTASLCIFEIVQALKRVPLAGELPSGKIYNTRQSNPSVRRRRPAS